MAQVSGNVFCELSADGKRIEVYFKYDPETVAAIKEVPGKRFVSRDDGGPFWTIPKDMMSARRLREVIGDRLTLGDAVTEWGKEARAAQRNLDALATADDAELPVLQARLPELFAFYRPFQRADVAFMAAASVLNANEQGLGKTVEAVGAIYEAQLDDGPQLIIAPLTSLETVWQYEFEKWTDMPIILLSGDHKLDSHDRNNLGSWVRNGEKLAIVTTAAQVRSGGLEAALNYGYDDDDKVPINEFPFKTLTVDEFHKTGATNVSGDPNKGTQFGRELRNIVRERTWFMSGTPTGGRPIRLWGVLNHTKPEVFTSKWRWAENWVIIDEDTFFVRGGGTKTVKKITNNLRSDRIDEFYPAHAQFIVRRLKKDVAPELPEKLRIDVMCEMLPAQKKQYLAMEEDAETRIDGERIVGAGVLAEMTRLRQFANAECTVKDGAVYPKKSNKLPYLIEKLDEVGIRPDNKDGIDSEGDSVAIVASQSERFVRYLHAELNKIGISAELITGKVKAKDRAELQRRFQSGTDSPRVIVMTTTAGGTAITLDRADTMHVMDETWDPDDQAQVEDRIHRLSRIHQVTAFYYRSKGTIEEDIHVTTSEKEWTGAMVMDVLREKHRKQAA